MRVVLLVPAILFMFCSFPAMGGENPIDLVKEFFSRDFQGERLEGKAAGIRDLVSWEEEPGWDSVYVCEKWEIKSSHFENGSGIVQVWIHVLGFAGEDIERRSFVEVIEFKLSKRAKGWKIDGPVVPPHVSKEALSSHMEKQLQKKTLPSKDADRIKRNREFLNFL